MTSELDSVKRNFIYNAIYQISRVVIPLITVPYLARVLGADGMGEYAYVFTIADYFALFVMLGVKNYGIRTIAAVRKDKTQLSKTFWEIYAFQFLCGAAVVICYLIYCLRFASFRLFSLIMIGYVISFQVDITWLFSGLEDFRTVSIRDLSLKLLSAILIFCFVNDRDDVIIYVIISSVGYLLSQISIWLLVKNKVDFCSPNRTAVVSHIRPIIILFLPTVAVSIYIKMDRIMLGVMSSITELGYYDASEKVKVVILAGVNALNIAMLPRMAYLFADKGSESDSKAVLYKSIEFAMLLTAGTAFGMMAVAREFVPLFYGEGFDKCIALFYWMSLSGLCIAFTNTILHHYLIPRNRDNIFLIARVAAAAINLILNFILIPLFASEGAAAATLAAEIGVSSVQIIMARKELDLKRCWNSVWPYILSGLFMFVIVYSVNIPLDNLIAIIIGKAILGVILYLGFIVIGKILLRKVKIFE